ncbi:MAG: type I 3-dehydroquinate dehydratase [Syntrophales bacterium]|jgi:3-dehydroquinate dehydratase/shikimate dehydrogenase|nr:type I 3-dehydroquinate dehydratase [Syntrophales bacterium]MCK9527387.1 type I 3-dehydroquinate dehydratase [Syntrophales bacterium]MDX9921489.1 type I 3-dehydroquinate dehydratase [Syntrophales bacterium]
MICLSLEPSTTGEALGMMRQAFSMADMVELRLDAFRELDLDRLMANVAGPVLVTNRSRTEGGRFEGTERERCYLIDRAMALGADYADIELSTDAGLLEDLVNRARGGRTGTRVILSFHDFEKTPSLEELLAIAGKAFDRGAHMAKLAVMARTMEDNITILNLVSLLRKRKLPVAAFCMGERGRISRLAAPLFGSAITFASLERGGESAPGQFTVEEVRRFQEILT